MGDEKRVRGAASGLVDQPSSFAGVALWLAPDFVSAELLAGSPDEAIGLGRGDALADGGGVSGAALGIEAVEVPVEGSEFATDGVESVDAFAVLVEGAAAGFAEVRVTLAGFSCGCVATLTLGAGAGFAAGTAAVVAESATFALSAAALTLSADEEVEVVAVEAGFTGFTAVSFAML